MRKILIATHGEFAGGLKQTMDFVLGGNEKVGVLSAYTAPEFDMDSGSVANAFSGHISHPGVYVLAGVNAPMLLAMVPMLESAMDSQELITQGIQAAREGCVFINGLMKQAFEESEEDFV